MGYDQDYERHAAVFGEEPDPLLVAYEGRIAPGCRVLDVGAGQGRHSLYLARRGRRVHAIDPARVGLEQLAAAAKAEGLPVVTEVGGWQELGEGPYGAVLLFGLLQLLSRAEIARLVARVVGWLDRGGLALVTTHTTEDDGCVARTHDPGDWRPVEPGSFRLPDGTVRTYLAPGELAASFAPLEVVYDWEGVGPEHRHGAGPEHRHAIAHVVCRKP